MPRGCDVDGCGGSHFGGGFCCPHYMRFRRHGDPLGGGPPKRRDYQDPHYLEGIRAGQARRDYNDPAYTWNMATAMQRFHGWFDDGTLEMSGPEFRADAIRRYKQEVV